MQFFFKLKYSDVARPAPVYTSCQSVVLFSPVHIDHPIHRAAHHFLFKWASHLTFSHNTPLPGSPGPSRSRARNIFQSRKYFLNPIHQLRLCSETRRARQMIDATETGARSDVGKYFLLKTKIISLSSSYHRRKLATDAYPLRGRWSMGVEI